MTRQQSAPDLYKSTQHRCPYLLDQTAANLLVDPVLMSHLPCMTVCLIMVLGVMVRFTTAPTPPSVTSVAPPGNSRKRLQTEPLSTARLKRNEFVTTELRTARFTEEHFSLYRRTSQIVILGTAWMIRILKKKGSFKFNSKSTPSFLNYELGVDYCPCR
ncbi:MAG: hypothetical protein CM1200mP18_14930 [Gammaproteobacteria bacterium]|nr:MAG: hypothetical protein CM1200mP18_14930 [Gammaproteobacteria bacterium]